LPNDSPSDEIIGGSASQSRRVANALLLGQSLPAFAISRSPIFQWEKDFTFERQKDCREKFAKKYLHVQW
jgi:hypothetical protein